MAKKKTAINWTDYTVNPYGWHCQKTSLGCKNCYMFAEAARYNMPDPASSWSTRFDEAQKELDGLPDGVSVILNDMSDTYYSMAELEDVQAVHKMTAGRPGVSFVICTKRPERALELTDKLLWPANLWLMVTVETSNDLHRIQTALKTGAAHVAVGAEPLLGPLDGLEHWLQLGDPYGYYNSPRKVEWLITGGESGPNRRPAEYNWFRQVRDVGQEHTITYHHKQGNGFEQGQDRLLDGRLWEVLPDGLPVRKTA
ncbi:DUF5131 family protein [Chloroflexota bacterium]